MTTRNLIINIAAFAILTGLWLGFAAALALNPVMLDDIWRAFGGLSFIVQILVGVLLLPLVLGLWIWETSWPLWLRLILIIGLGFATTYAFLPRRPQSTANSQPTQA